MARPKTLKPRSKHVKIRFTDDEYLEIKNLIGTQPVSSFIRSLLFSKRKFFIPSSDYLKSINELVKEQKKIGTNINQLAHEVNSLKYVGGGINPQKADQIILKISELYAIESEMSNLFLELIRKAKAI
jgi:hypothetical protein